jgi:hypothetical protein
MRVLFSFDEVVYVNDRIDVLIVAASEVGFEDGSLINSNKNNNNQHVHTTPADQESSLTLPGLPKREASNAVMAMRKTVIFAMHFIFLICSRDEGGASAEFLKICEMRDARCASILTIVRKKVIIVRQR